MSELDAGLARIAAADRLLVAADFDGTLSPIAPTPDAAKRDEGACTALVELSRLEGTTAAVVSGRDLGALRRLLGAAGPELRLIGSHGAEPDDARPTAPEAVDPAPDLVGALESVAGRYAGALVERKPLGVAFHYREVDRGVAEAAAQAAIAAVRRSGARLQEGHEVIEGVFADADKGSALESLRRSTGATAIVFIGDDVTDERAFERLGPTDLGVKVGPGPTAAKTRVDGQGDVAPLLERLLDVRRRHVADARS